VLNYAETHYKKAKEQDKLAKASIGAQLLKIHTGINGLHFESALVDPTAPPGIVTIPGGRPGEPCVRVLSVFSNEDTSYESRPSQEQVNRLSQIMGKQPRWWVDYDDPRLYGW
jgi:hypothetical protein